MFTISNCRKSKNPLKLCKGFYNVMILYCNPDYLSIITFLTTV